MKRFHITLSLGRLSTGVAALALIAGVGAHHTGQSSAAASYNHNPTAFADYCRLSGSTTVLSGWAYDPDAPAGSLPNVTVVVAGRATTVATNIAGYRDAPINSFINKYYAGAPTNNTYGWQLSLAGYYKGTAYAVSGTGLNYGTGANTTLSVHSGSYVDNNGANIPYNANGTIPDACLAVRPAAPTPAPTPTPAAPKSKSSPSTTKQTNSSAPAATSPGTPPASDANGVATTGTTAVSIVIPVGGASKVHLSYAITGGPAVGTDDQPVGGDSTTVSLSGLTAHADYTYQIIRTNSAGVSSTSAAAGFSTKGYSVQLNFTDSKKKPVSGIEGSINDQNNSTAKSDKDGKLTFKDLPDGSYTVAYTYKNVAYTKDFDTVSDTSSPTNDDGTPRTITLTDAVNVDKLATSGTTITGSAGHHNTFLVVLGVLFVLGLIGAGLWFLIGFIRRRKLQAEYSTLGTPLGGAGTVDQAPVVTSVSPTNAPLPAHAGESLREMVLESMREQHQLPQQQPLGDLAARSAALPPQPAASHPISRPVAEHQVPAPAVPDPAPAHKPHAAHTSAQPAHHAEQPIQQNTDGSKTLHINHDD